MTRTILTVAAAMSAVGVSLGEAAAADAATRRFIDVSKEDPHYFAEANGRTWLPIGCNICFDRLEKPSAEARALFDGWMTKFAANGGNFMRVWLSAPFVEVMPEKAGVYSAEATENIKWLVGRAEQLGIRLKFTFENFRRIAPERTDRNPEKGIISFIRPAYVPYAKNMREFFTSEACFRIYAARARHVAEAVGDSPALVAVELWNEVTSTGAPLEAIAKWTDRMMPEIQRIFPKQMVAQNLGSFSEINSFRIYDWLASVKGNAFLQAHRYQDLGAPMDVVKTSMDVHCADVIRELRDRRPDLPTFLSEVGAVESRHSGPSRFYAADKEGALIHDAIFAPFFAGSAGCGQPWHWDHQYIDGNGLWYHFGRFAKAVKGLDPVAERFRPFRTETNRLRVYGLRGRTTTVLWCRDKQNGWKEEFVEKKASEEVSGERLPFTSATGYDVYLPFEDRAAKAPAGDCVLPPFKRSCVVRFASVPAVWEANASATRTLDTATQTFYERLLKLADEGKAMASWTHAWPEKSAKWAKKSADGTWTPKPQGEIDLDDAAVFKLTGRHPLLHFTDFREVSGTYEAAGDYARNAAAMEAVIKESWRRFGSVPVFSWHLENPYVPTGWKDPKHGGGMGCRYRFASKDYPQEHRYVIREILEGTGAPCGAGKRDPKVPETPAFANPRDWYWAQVDKVTAFLNRLRDESGNPIPCVVRFFHEMEDDWMWWGPKSVSPEDFRRFCRETAEAFRRAVNGGRNLLFLYSPDRYWKDLDRYMTWYPGDDVTDIIGFDDYSIGVSNKTSTVEQKLEVTIGKMRLVSEEARRRGKACGLIECGCYGPDVVDGFYSCLLKALSSDGVRFSFFNTWGVTAYTVPARPAGVEDWKRYLADPRILTAPCGVE